MTKVTKSRSLLDAATKCCFINQMELPIVSAVIKQASGQQISAESASEECRSAVAPILSAENSGRQLPADHRVIVKPVLGGIHREYQIIQMAA